MLLQEGIPGRCLHLGPSFIHCDYQYDAPPFKFVKVSHFTSHQLLITLTGLGPQHNSANVANDVLTTLMDTATSASMPGAASTGGVLEATSTSNMVNREGPKDHGKESGCHVPQSKHNSKVSFSCHLAACPHTVSYRNLYASDFLKDHQVRCKEFVKVQYNLGEDTRMVVRPSSNTI